MDKYALQVAQKLKSQNTKNNSRMARIDPKSAPEKYIQELKHRPLDHELSPLSPNDIPTIDFSLLARGDEDERRKPDSARKNWVSFRYIFCILPTHGTYLVCLIHVLYFYAFGC